MKDSRKITNLFKAVAISVILMILATASLSGCFRAEEKTETGKLTLLRIGDFQNPVYAAGNDLISGRYIVEQDGKVILERAGGKSVFLDIKNRAKSDGEQGLLSIAFPPDFKRTRLFYVYFTNKEEKQVIAEGTGNTAGTRGKLTRDILVMNDFAANHNGGQIVFGPGGLYIGTGDGGGSGDPERTALNLNSLLGKILRIDPGGSGGAPYSIPANNPFRGVKGARPEIFSYGLRNPWRFSINDGRIFIGDVGQNDREEISAPTLTRARGGNFGWSRFEGRRDFNLDQAAENPIFPVLEYKHKDGRCSVTGGLIVSNNNLPTLKGRYIYSDFCQGVIRSFKLENGRAVSDRSEGLSVPGLVSFAKVNGDILVISNNGMVYRLIEKNVRPNS